MSNQLSVSLILANPKPGSFNHAIAQAALQTLRQNGHHVSFHDLCKEGFDPTMPYQEIPKGASVDPVIQKHCHEIAIAEGIIIVHPNWWGQPPEILKGWIDRVIRPGVAYEFLEGDSGEGVLRGLQQAKAALVFNTSNTAPERELGIFGDPLETLWKNCIFDLCGVKIFYRKTCSIIATSTMKERVARLKDVTETVNRYFPDQIKR